MKLVAQLKLSTTPDQASALTATMLQVNLACQFVGDVAWASKTFNKFALQHVCYTDIRSKFHLSAQAAVRAISKVSDSYKVNKKTRRTYRTRGAIVYDDRILSWSKTSASIWTVNGRARIPFACGEQQKRLLQSRKGQTNLVRIKGAFYLLTACDVEEEAPIAVQDFLGVDLGVANIAVDSDKRVHSSKHLNRIRHKRQTQRARLQSTGTKSARRRLKRLSGKERRFAKDVNHCVSKKMVAVAKGTNRGIALEDLKGIRSRTTARSNQRATLNNWSFFQLRAFIGYKAQGVGVPVVFVDPRNTSRTCPRCAHVDKANRKSQSLFSCVACGFADLADYVAAVNISRRAVVNQPIVAQHLGIQGAAASHHL